MVCVVSSSIMNNSSESNKNTSNRMESDQTTELIDLDESNEYNEGDNDNNDDNDDGLKLRRIAGGSIVKYPPLYSPDGEQLFIIYKETIQICSTITGQWLRNLEGSKNDIISINYDLNNQKILISCSEQGEIIKWKWKSGSIESRFQLNQLKNFKVQTFNLLDISSSLSPCAFITYKKCNTANVDWVILNIDNGKELNCPLKMHLSSQKLLVAAETKYFHYFVIVQKTKMVVVNYKNWRVIWWNSAKQASFTYVQCHPKEEMIATGDSMGRIFLWREFWQKKEPKTTLYHWHHTAVTCIAFTTTGSGFYSSGIEAVLVKWNIDRPDQKYFLPRMVSPICHIIISPENQNIAVATDDNGIQILNNQREVKCVLQNFTYIPDDKTELDKYPVGLKLNPRSNCLVLNGRPGNLQFYSTYTKSLLYNMDVVIQNRLSMETQKILYNTRVTKAAFNIDWIVTGEEWNDQQHSPEIRLKFWEFKKEEQSYCLNTNVELPHEGSFTALEFSDFNQNDNLLCVSVGCDNIIKIWSLDDCDSIYKKGKVWYCIGKTSFKNMPIKSVSFSLDGSLLAAGFGNSLCIYKSENLKLKTILTAPCGFDGTIKKLQIQIPSKYPEVNVNKNKNFKNINEIEKEQKILEFLNNFIENNEQELLAGIKRSGKIKRKKINSTEFIEMIESNKNLRDNLFKTVHSLSELNLFQKLCIYQKLELFCMVPKEMQNKILSYITATILKCQQNEMNLHNKIINRIDVKDKFKAKYRLHKYLNRNKIINDNQINDKLISLIELLNLNDDQSNLKDKQNKMKIKNKNMMINNNNDDMSSSMKMNGFYDDNNEITTTTNTTTTNTIKSNKEITLATTPTKYSLSRSNHDDDVRIPVQNTSSIRHVLFATGDYAHLVVVCTEHRILIWNILTLKLQCVLKLSVREISVDPITSLFAVFTINNEFYVFLPNAPMPLYLRKNLPNIRSACWVPRRCPKSQSINLDWQSMSILYFLTDKQELMCLVSDNDRTEENFESMSTSQLNNDVQDIIQYTTFGTYAIKQIHANDSYKTNNLIAGSSSSSALIGIPGKSSIKSLIEMPTHAMAPANLLCHTLIRSLIGVDESNNKLKVSSSSVKNSTSSDNDNKEDDHDADDDGIIEKRKLTQQLLINKLKTENHNLNVTDITSNIQQKSEKDKEKLRKIFNENMDTLF